MFCFLLSVFVHKTRKSNGDMWQFWWSLYQFNGFEAA